MFREAALESIAVFQELSLRFYGGMPAQLGYCNGNNHLLNCLEYHRDSELNIVADDVVLLVAPCKSLKMEKMDTKEVEAFSVPAGTAVQFMKTTLHYAPCTATGKAGFRVAVMLPRGQIPKNLRLRCKTRRNVCFGPVINGWLPIRFR